ncbi:MAG: UDP-N-acetylmuramoyl-tripeptide--D-alanyl-D-alanine ligase [Marinifilaceae bacterium]
MQIKDIYSIFLQYPSICTDSRKINKDDIFFAIKGESFNGNKFAEKAIKEGCSFAIIDEKKYKTSEKHILVKNVLTCLQELASFHRDQLKIPIIGITGTNGKTTTKELIRAVLEVKFNTYATEGNFNNHIGVPLSLLSINSDHEIAVIEMGANHQHEIAQLTNIVKPNFGIITNIGKAHLEGFGSFDNLKNTKKELYDYIEKYGELLFVNKDNAMLTDMSAKIKRFTYGSKEADSKAKYTQASPFLIIELVSPKGLLYIKTKLIGGYNYENVLAAASIGRYFKIDDIYIKKSLEEYIPSNNRSQLKKTERNTLILDSYNANPTSMTAAIINFREIKDKNKALILGDMLELGKESNKEHKLIIKLIEDNKFKKIFLVGSEFFKQECQSYVKKFEKTEDLIELLKKEPIDNHTVLIKGSRGIKLEDCIDIL